MNDREWKVARSEAGKLYFYHRKTRKTQWHMPEDGIIVNIKDFPELQQSVPVTGAQESGRRKQDGIRKCWRFPTRMAVLRLPT